MPTVESNKLKPLDGVATYQKANREVLPLDGVAMYQKANREEMHLHEQLDPTNKKVLCLLVLQKEAKGMFEALLTSPLAERTRMTACKESTRLWLKLHFTIVAQA